MSQNQNNITTPPVAETRFIPRRSTGHQPDVLVPAEQAGIEALAWAALLTLLVGAGDYFIQPTNWLEIPVYIFAYIFTFLVVFIYRWPGHLRQARSTAFEHLTLGADTNGDGIVQAAEHKRPVYAAGRIGEPDMANAKHTKRLREFVADSRAYGTAGRKLEAQGWLEDEIELLASYLIANGAGRWKNTHNHQSGWHLAQAAKVEDVIRRTIWV